jgi:hypothetical protein
LISSILFFVFIVLKLKFKFKIQIQNRDFYHIEGVSV